MPEVGLGIGRYRGLVGGLSQEILTWYDAAGDRQSFLIGIVQYDAKYGKFDRDCDFGNFGDAARAISLESLGGICFIIQSGNR